jgi:GT2 family glycosyltransferase
MTVVFCLPGNSFSGRFLECWTDVVSHCLKSGIRLILSRQQSCNIYYVRNMCLGADVLRGPGQKPFDGKIDYDYLMWIDSDNLFSAAQFQRLLEHKQDIVSGLYLMEDGTHFATVKDWDEEHFAKHGSFSFMTPKDVQAAQGLIEVAYTGMGFMLVKKGVFESLDYPWFRPIEKKIGGACDFTMEDVALCLRAREMGYRVMVDPGVRVGHEKRVVL